MMLYLSNAPLRVLFGKLINALLTLNTFHSSFVEGRKETSGNLSFIQVNAKRPMPCAWYDQTVTKETKTFSVL